jgi:hypothetical protein
LVFQKKIFFSIYKKIKNDKKMNKFKEFLGDNYFWIVLIIFVCIFMNTCSQQRNNKELIKQNQVLVLQNGELIKQLDSLKHEFVNKDELQLYLRIMQYSISEAIMVDFNDIARTRTSPTERSRYYFDRIRGLETQLNRSP